MSSNPEADYLKRSLNMKWWRWNSERNLYNCELVCGKTYTVDIFIHVSLPVFFRFCAANSDSTVLSLLVNWETSCVNELILFCILEICPTTSGSFKSRRFTFSSFSPSMKWNCNICSIKITTNRSIVIDFSTDMSEFNVL